MDIKEIKTKKHDLSMDLLILIEKFEKETSVNIESIDLIKCATNPMGKSIRTVRIKIEI